MKHLLSFLTAVAVGSASCATWTHVMSAADIDAFIGAIYPGSFGCVTASADGTIAVKYISGGSVTAPVSMVALIKPEQQTSITLLSNTAMRSAIDDANGTASLPASLSVQAMRFNAAGKLVVYSYETTNQNGVLMTIDPVTTSIAVLSCARNGEPAPLQGYLRLIVDGNMAYLTDDGYTLPGPGNVDAVYAFNTASGVTNGTMTPTLVINQSMLQTAAGAADPNSVSPSGGASLSASTLLVMNTAAQFDFSTNEDILLANVGGTPSVSKYVSGADIKADTGVASTVRWRGLAVRPGGFDIACSAGVIHVNNVSSPNADATFETVQSIYTQFTQVFQLTVDDGIAYDGFRNRMLLSTYKPLVMPPADAISSKALPGYGNIIAYSLIGSTNAVREWELYD